MSVKVYDLSKWNTITNYTALGTEVAGVILRLGYRGAASGTLAIDPTFKNNVEKFNSLKAPIGVYFFSTAISSSEAEEEAKFCIDNIKKLGLEIQFPIFIDTEYCNVNHNGRSDSISKKTRTVVVKSFIDYCRKNGYEAAIYASESWYKSMLIYDDIKQYKKWVAKYSTTKPSLDNMIGWQYTSNGESKGIKGKVDVSEWYVTISKSYAKYNKNKKKETIKFNDGQEITLENTDLFSSSISSKVVSKKTGTYYIWSSAKKNDRIRITNDPANVRDATKVTGWIRISDIK